MNLNYVEQYDLDYGFVYIPSILILKAFTIQARDKTGNGPYTHVYTWQEYLDGAADHCYALGLIDDRNLNPYPYGRVIHEQNSRKQSLSPS